MSKTLDLGCGAKPKNPFNADEFFGIDVRNDLNLGIKKADLIIENIPFENEMFDYVTAFDFLEHIPRVIYAPSRRNAFVELMNEIYRVLKNGGLFLSMTPAYPNAVAFRDPTHVNIITDETFPLYFDSENRWASIYGFNGAFKILKHEWQGPHIFAILQKVDVQRPINLIATELKPEITIVMPVFNGGKYIEKTLDSIIKQDFKNFELICVDDCSEDSSCEIIEKLIQKDNRIRLIKNSINLGSASRTINVALKNANGRYFVYTSQDDFFSTDWLLRMHEKALSTGADAIIPNLVFYDSNNDSNKSLSGLNGNKTVELNGREALIYSLDWSIPGNALWKMELIKKVGYSDFSINSDEYSVRNFFLNSEKVVFSEGTFYYRQDNVDAITKRISHKTFEYALTQLRLVQLLKKNNLPDEILNLELSPPD